MKQRKGEKEMTYPYVEIGKNEYHLDMQEMVLWSVLNWRILSADEIKKLYEKKVNELGLGYHKTMEACQYHLMQRGLIAEGVGEIPADALYDLLSNLYVVPVSENIFLRLFSFVRLTFKGIPLKVTKKILFRDKRSDGEKKVMRIAHQATFSTAEIIKCVEVDRTHFANDEEILDAIYHDEHLTSDNIAYSVKTSPACHPVLTDVANLYLRQQIIFTDLNSRGHSSLSITESGDVIIKQDEREIKKATLEAMPDKVYWHRLAKVFQGEGLAASVTDSAVVVSW